MNLGDNGRQSKENKRVERWRYSAKLRLCHCIMTVLERCTKRSRILATVTVLTVTILRWLPQQSPKLHFSTIGGGGGDESSGGIREIVAPILGYRNLASITPLLHYPQASIQEYFHFQLKTYSKSHFL